MNEKRPRGYGEPTGRGYEKAQDALSDWIAFNRGHHGARWLEVQAEGFGREVEEAGYASRVEAYERQKTAYLLAATDLPRSEPFWVSSDVVELIEVSRHTLPAFELQPSDLLVPHGFVALETPISTFYDESTAPLVAFAWTSFRGPSGRDYVLATAFSTVPAVSEVAFPGVGQTADYEFPIAKLLVSFWLLAKQRLLVHDRREVSRPVRRRAKTQEIKTVTVVRLRRQDRSSIGDKGRNVGWTHRWLVRGFWRNQWYPSENRQRPIWIADYVKGPTDKPFVAKNRAFEFVR